MDELVRRLREKQADMNDAIQRLDCGEFDNGIMRIIRLEQRALYKDAADRIEADAARIAALEADLAAVDAARGA